MEVLLTSMEGAAALHWALLNRQSIKQSPLSRTAGRLRALQTLLAQMTSPLPQRVTSTPGSGTLTRSRTHWMITCGGHCHAEGTLGGSLAELGNTELSLSICMQHRKARSAQFLFKGSYCCFTGSFGLFSGEPRRQAVKTEVSCSNYQAQKGGNNENK